MIFFRTALILDGRGYYFSFPFFSSSVLSHSLDVTFPPSPGEIWETLYTPVSLIANVTDDRLSSGMKNKISRRLKQKKTVHVKQEPSSEQRSEPSSEQRSEPSSEQRSEPNSVIYQVQMEESAASRSALYELIYRKGRRILTILFFLFFFFFISQASN